MGTKNMYHCLAARPPIPVSYFFGFYSNIYSQSTPYTPIWNFPRLNCVLLSRNPERLALIILTVKPCELSFNLVTAIENTIIELSNVLLFLHKITWMD